MNRFVRLLALLVTVVIPASAQERPAQIVVVGDSLIWGQGLKEEDKTYSLVRDWYETEHLKGARRAELVVKAHSGATVKLHDNERAGLKKAGLTEDTVFNGEISFGFPSTFKQLEMAHDDLEARGAPAGDVELILVSGCITDISVGEILNPLGGKKKMPKLVQQYCGRDMLDLLHHAHSLFPNARIAVLGYYPTIGPKTRSSKLLDGWLESMSFPRPAKPLANNVMTRRVFALLRKRAVEGSRVFHSESTRRLQEAVAAFNTRRGGSRAFFVESPVTEESTLDTPGSLLFNLVKRGRSEDPLYDFRTRECRGPQGEIRKKAGIKESVRHCEISGVGHPNERGASGYYRNVVEAWGKTTGDSRR
jgi:hypothetical protein